MTTVRTASFTLSGERVKIEFRLESAQMLNNPEARTIDLDPLPADAMDLRLTGSCDGCLGQINSALREKAEEAGEPDVLRLCALWDRWHLNGMQGGTRAQNAILADSAAPQKYDDRCQFLKDRGLYVDHGYKYGTAWLYKPLDAGVMEEIERLLAALDGQRLGDVLDVADAPDLDVNILDSRDVIKRLEIYRAAAELIPQSRRNAGDLDEDEQAIIEELEALEAMERDGSGCGGWGYGELLIAESHFEEYAEQLADDIGADWKAAAEELKQDYTTVEYRGTTYLIHA